MARPTWKATFIGLVAALVVLMPACTTADNNGDDDAEANDGSGALDVETLQAESDGGTLEAEEVSDAFVGEVTEDLFIGVAVYDEGQYADDEQVGVYLCDDGDEINAWLTGELASEGVAELDADHEDLPDVRITVEVGDDEVTGEVVDSEGESHSFTASPASGDAGLYVAEATFDGEEHRGSWIVLEDGRQRGVTCPPFPIIVCLPTGPGPSTF